MNIDRLSDNLKFCFIFLVNYAIMYLGYTKGDIMEKNNKSGLMAKFLIPSLLGVARVFDT